MQHRKLDLETLYEGYKDILWYEGQVLKFQNKSLNTNKAYFHGMGRAKFDCGTVFEGNFNMGNIDDGIQRSRMVSASVATSRAGSPSMSFNANPRANYTFK